jgi:hypothetical protein
LALIHKNLEVFREILVYNKINIANKEEVAFVERVIYLGKEIKEEIVFEKVVQIYFEFFIIFSRNFKKNLNW